MSIEDEKVENGKQSPAHRLKPWARFALILPLLFTAWMASVYLYQARYDDQLNSYPYAWQAHWMRSPFPGKEVTCFRKTIDLDGPVRSAYVVVSADNFYTLYVNGSAPQPYFGQHDISFALESISYDEIGSDRHTSEGNVFNLTKLLHPGRNVIAILGETDRSTGTPGLAVQGMVRTGGETPIISDSSWKCAPKEETQNDIGWTQPMFDDTSWTPAQWTSEPAKGTVDGDARDVDQPMTAGSFIGLPNASITSDVHLRQTIVAPSGDSRGWLRVHTDVPYDLTVNGRLIASSASFDRYDDPVFKYRQKVDEESLFRSDSMVRAPAVPSSTQIAARDDVLFKHLFKPGENTLEVSLHGADQTATREIPSCYLDGVVDWDNGAEQRIVTDSSWQASTGVDGDWTRASIVATPNFTYATAPMANSKPLFVDAGEQRYVEIVADAGLIALGIAFVCLLFSLLSTICDRPFDFLQICGMTFAPAIVFGSAELLQATFEHSKESVYFTSSSYAVLVLAVAAISFVLTFALALLPSWIRRSTTVDRQGVWQSVLSFLDNYGYAAGVVATMVVTSWYCWRALNITPFNPDEYVSLEAARGIIRHGIPIYEHDGFIYSRSSLFHYLLALSLWFGTKTGHLQYSRIVAMVWSAATLPVIYLLGRELKSKAVGLAAAILVGFSPYMIFFGAEARFYSQLNFFTTLALYLLYKSLSHPDDHRRRVWVVLSMIAAYLSQQITLITVETFLVMILLAGQLKRWFSLKMLPWLAAFAIIIVIDLYLYIRLCMNALPYVDNMAKPLLGIHIDYLDLTMAMWMSNVERSQLVIGFFYVVGFAGAVWNALQSRRAGSEMRARNEGWTWWKLLYLFTGISMFLYAIHIPEPKTRYFCQIYPATVLAACCAIADLAMGVRVWATHVWRSPMFGRWAYSMVAVASAFLCVAALHPLRTYYSTDRRVNIDSDEVSHFIAAHRRPGDKLIYSSPEAAVMELGNCDFDWRPNEAALDKYLSLDGEIRERDSAGVVVDDVDKLRAAMTASPRIWLVLLPRSDIADGLGPSPALDDFVNNNFQVADESLGVTVWLWDRNYNQYHDTEADHERDQFLYSTPTNLDR